MNHAVSGHAAEKLAAADYADGCFRETEAVCEPLSVSCRRSCAAHHPLAAELLAPSASSPCLPLHSDLFRRCEAAAAGCEEQRAGDELAGERATWSRHEVRGESRPNYGLITEGPGRFLFSR